MPFAISKSAFLKGMQCSKQLYLYYHFPHLRDAVTVKEKAAFKRGADIGLLAHVLFPNGISAKTSGNYTAWFGKTRELIEKGATTIFEAAFKNQYQMSAIDILDFKNDIWYAWEVKSVLKIQQIHLYDLAFQYHTIRKCGINLQVAGLIHLNADYKRRHTLEISELFTFTELTEQVVCLADQIASYLEEMQEMLNANQTPSAIPGIHCAYPYACAYMKYCWSTLFAHQQIYISDKALISALIDKGIIAELSSENIQRECDPIMEENIVWLRTAVPWFQHTSPYEKIPFLRIEKGRKILLQPCWREGLLSDSFPINQESNPKSGSNNPNMQQLELILNELFTHLAICNTHEAKQDWISKIETVLQ